MIYYWKVQVVNKIVIVHAHTAKECDILIKAWIRKQNLPEDTKYTKGNSFCIKKGTSENIVEEERKHLEQWM